LISWHIFISVWLDPKNPNAVTLPYILRRIEVYGTDALWKQNQKLTFGMNDASLLYPLKYYWSRIRARIS